MQAAQGLTGHWHLTTGEWKDSGHLETLCGKGVSSHHRQFGDVLQAVTCPSCKRLRRKRR